MRTKTKKNNMVIPGNLTAKQEALVRLQQNGYVSLADAANILFADTNFPTQQSHIARIVTRLKKHYPNCIKSPSKTFIKKYQTSHQGERPEVNYVITESIINNLKEELIK